jgi:capsular exopolysaccharide synthesis family protein
MELPGARIVDARPMPAASSPALPHQALAVRNRRAVATLDEPPEVLSTTPSVPGLLYAARRRWRLALFLGLVCAAGAGSAVWFTQTEKYIARTMVLINAQAPILVADPRDRSDFGSYQRTQVAYVKSRLVLNAALRDPKVADLSSVRERSQPVLWLEKEIQVDFSVAPEVLRIQMTGEHSHELIAIVDAVREAYLMEVNRVEVEGRQKRLAKLKEIYAEKDQHLLEKRRLLKQMQEESGATKDGKALERAQEAYVKKLEALNNELIPTRMKILMLQMDRDTKVGPAPPSPKEIDDAVNKNSDVISSAAKVENLDAQIEEMKKNFREPELDEAYKRAVKARQSEEQKLRALRDKLRENYAKRAIEANSGHDDRTSAELTRFEKQASWLEDQLEKHAKNFKEVKKAQIGMEWLRDELSLTETLAKTVANQMQILEIEMQAPQRSRLLEEATSVPDKDARIKKAGVAGGGVFSAVVFLIAFLEFRSRRVSNVDEVVRGLNLRLVGALPVLPARAGRQVGATPRAKDLRWQSQLTESVEAARTMLLHAAQAEAMQVILVTSAVGGEGKTLTCSHLAVSLARAGRKTLLIDADLRRPALQSIFKLALGPGLSEVLRGDAELGTAIQESPVPGLSVLTAGTRDDRALQALAQPKLDEIICNLKERYQFVIVDSAPVLLVADTQQIAQRCDGVLFSVLQDVSRLPEIYAAVERLAALRIRILGAVVNGADSCHSASYYPYTRNS